MSNSNPQEGIVKESQHNGRSNLKVVAIISALEEKLLAMRSSRFVWKTSDWSS